MKISLHFNFQIKLVYISKKINNIQGRDKYENNLKSGI